METAEPSSVPRIRALTEQALELYAQQQQVDAVTNVVCLSGGTIVLNGQAMNMVALSMVGVFRRETIEEDVLRSLREMLDKLSAVESDSDK